MIGFSLWDFQCDQDEWETDESENDYEPVETRESHPRLIPLPPLPTRTGSAEELRPALPERQRVAKDHRSGSVPLVSEVLGLKVPPVPVRTPRKSSHEEEDFSQKVPPPRPPRGVKGADPEPPPKLPARNRPKPPVVPPVPKPIHAQEDLDPPSLPPRSPRLPPRKPRKISDPRPSIPNRAIPDAFVPLPGKVSLVERCDGSSLESFIVPPLSVYDMFVASLFVFILM